MAEVNVSNYATGLISGVVAISIAVAVIPGVMASINNLTGVPILSGALIGTVIGAGVVLLALKVFL